MSQIQATDVEQTISQKSNQTLRSSAQTLRKSKELTLDEKEKTLIKRGWTHEYAGYDDPSNTAQTSSGADGSD
jgi:hypothetical protein